MARPTRRTITNNTSSSQQDDMVTDMMEETLQITEEPIINETKPEPTITKESVPTQTPVVEEVLKVEEQPAQQVKITQPTQKPVEVVKEVVKPTVEAPKPAPRVVEEPKQVQKAVEVVIKPVEPPKPKVRALGEWYGTLGNLRNSLFQRGFILKNIDTNTVRVIYSQLYGGKYFMEDIKIVDIDNILKKLEKTNYLKYRYFIDRSGCRTYDNFITLPVETKIEKLFTIIGRNNVFSNKNLQSLSEIMTHNNIQF